MFGLDDIIMAVMATAPEAAGEELTYAAGEEMMADAAASELEQQAIQQAAQQAAMDEAKREVVQGGIQQGVEKSAESAIPPGSEGGINPNNIRLNPDNDVFTRDLLHANPEAPQGIEQAVDTRFPAQAAPPAEPAPRDMDVWNAKNVYEPVPGMQTTPVQTGNIINPVTSSTTPIEAGSTGLQKGIESAMKFTKDYPLISSLGIQAAGRLIDSNRGSGGPPKENYKKKDMGGYNTSSPSTINYNSKFGSTPYALGGAVEQMSAENALGANQMYPQSQVQSSMYSNPMVQRPVQNNVINSGIDTPTDAYTGEMKYAAGGTTTSEPNYAQMLGAVTPEQQKANEEYLQAYAKKEMANSIHTDSDVDTAKKDPLHASMARLQKIGKRVGVKTADLPKSGIVDSNVFHAAVGGDVPDPDRKYYNPNNSALRAEQAQNEAQPDMGIFSFLTQMFGGGFGGVKGPGAAGFPTLQGFNKNPNEQRIHYTGMADGGITHGLGGYSDGGRLLKGPGDGVSDSIPATIGNKQPARLADGEFVVPARIVSELGNGSTDAGARKLYEMMERVQADRKKSIGKGKVAVNSKAAKHLPK